MTMWIAIALVLLVLGGYLSALSLAMIVASPSAVESRAASVGRAEGAKWLASHQDAARLSVSLVRTMCRIGVFAMLLLEYAGGLDENGRIVVTPTDLLLAGIISVLLLWIATVVLGTALARHAAAPLIVSALPLVRVLGTVFGPFVRLFGFLDEAVRRLTGANLAEDEDEVQADLLRRIEDTEREGRIDQQAAELLENIVEFSTTCVSEVMTPRTKIDGLELTDDIDAIREFIAKAGHSRIPVYRDNLDHVEGILYVRDLLPYLGVDPPEFRLEPILRKPIFVPDTKSVSDLLAEFQRGEVHMAIVVDEYGGTAGLATIEDVLEEIVGEIRDEHDAVDEVLPDLEQVDERCAIADGAFRIDELNERLDLDIPEEDYDTIAGFLLASFGRVPEAGESFESHAARFTAVATSPTQIERVRIERLAPAEEA